MYVVFTIEVQDGMNTRYTYHTEIIEEQLTEDELVIKGEELVHEYFSYDELANDFYWDSSWETAGRYFRHHVIEDKKTWDVVNSIIN